MLITVQASFFASTMSASLTLNTVSSYWDLGPIGIVNRDV